MQQIAESASIGEGTTFGAFCVVEDGVTIGANCTFGHHVVIRAGTSIEDGVRIGDQSVVGARPMRAARSATTSDETPAAARIGTASQIGNGVIIYSGATIGSAVLVADLATVRENVSIGERTIVGRGVAIENNTAVGKSCKLETNAYITAHSRLDDFVFVAPGVLTSNDNFVGRSEERFKHFKGITVQRGGRIGVGAVVLPGRTVSEDGMVAAGALLTRDVEAGRIVAGHPARDFREVPEEQLLHRQNWFD